MKNEFFVDKPNYADISQNMGLYLKIILIAGFSFFAFADEPKFEEPEPPKNFECVGWLIGLQTFHSDEVYGYNETQIDTLEDLYDLDLKDLVQTTYYNYFYELVKQIQFGRIKKNHQKLLYYFEGPSAVDFVDIYLQTPIQSSWGLSTVNDQIRGALSGQEHRVKKMLRYTKYAAAGTILYALTHLILSKYMSIDHPALLAMEKMAPAAAFAIVIPLLQSILDKQRYTKMKLKLDENSETRAVELARKFKLDLFSHYIGNAISEPTDEDWAETTQIKNVNYHNLQDGTLTISYGNRNNTPFLLLGVEFRAAD